MKILAQSINSTGRLQVSICVDKKTKSCKVHRLVAEAFFGKPQNNTAMVCHKDGDPLNNTPENLYWGDARSNGADAIVHGRVQIGERNVNAKLTPEMVRAIRRDVRTSTIAAPEYGVAASTFCRIKKGRSWRHVT
jgi:HNH endonuclease